MASAATTARLSARSIARHTARNASSRRTFQTSAQCLAASNFTMPALSPTMTEGNIAKWRVEEGRPYSAGDVLLEIETDKATMDVEAQDDGILWKIIKGDESKAIKVGERIAVTAEEGDDLGSLELPADESPKQSGAAESASKEAAKPAEQAAPSAPQPSQPASSAPSKSSGSTAKAQKQTYPLYPAVQHLLYENGLTKADADQIPASGPGGRLLKGDVLAHLGRIQKEYPAQASARLDKLSHLDLSNIQLAAPKPAPKKVEAEKPAAPEPPKETKIALPISLSAVVATQKRVQDTLGVFLPLSTFIARASELANEDLPVGKRAPTQEDLFNAVLGLKAAPKISRGNYIPDVSGLAPSLSTPVSRKTPDIIDLLGPKLSKPAPAVGRTPVGVVANGANIFSVNAKAGEEKRVTEYLERVKVVLETDPGRLVV